jgi:hypothetical protein
VQYQQNLGQHRRRLQKLWLSLNQQKMNLFRWLHQLNLRLYRQHQL